MKFKLEDIIILYEDNHLLVVLKPQGLASCSNITGNQNLLDMLKDYIVKKYNKPGNAYLGLVHRLDQPTGGVMVFAKSSKAASRLAASMKKKEFEKKYFAILEGIPQKREDCLKNALFKDAKKNEVYCVPVATEGAKSAELEYKTLSVKGNRALVEINLITGRAHQARVQMANIACPILGDQKYSVKKEKIDLALWAYELAFPHPVLKDYMVFKVYPPIESYPWSEFDVASKIKIIR